MTYPWENQLPMPADEPLPPAAVEQIVAALQRDFAYAVANTAVLVHSNNPAFQMLVNVPRGQIVPHDKSRFSDGTTIELQDVGMCQPGVPHMSVQDLLTKLWQLATEMGLELAK